MNSKICPVCGKKFTCYGKTIYCSHDCYIKAMNQRRLTNYHQQRINSKRFKCRMVASTVYDIAKKGDENALEQITDVLYNEFKK